MSCTLCCTTGSQCTDRRFSTFYLLGSRKSCRSVFLFTFFRISTDDTKGTIKAYLGTGEITDDPYGMDGCIAVTKVDNLQILMKHICRNGFEHHVAMVRNDVKDILNEAIEGYLGWNLYVHE